MMAESVPRIAVSRPDCSLDDFSDSVDVILFCKTSLDLSFASGCFVCGTYLQLLSGE